MIHKALKTVLFTVFRIQLIESDVNDCGMANRVLDLGMDMVRAVDKLDQTFGGLLLFSYAGNIVIGTVEFYAGSALFFTQNKRDITAILFNLYSLGLTLVTLSGIVALSRRGQALTDRMNRSRDALHLLGVRLHDIRGGIADNNKPSSRIHQLEASMDAKMSYLLDK